MADLNSTIVRGSLRVAGGSLLAGAALFDAAASGAPLILKGGASDYREGLRIVSSSGGWSDILLGGLDASETQGTSANSWFLGNNNGNFYITRNGSSSSSSAILKCESNIWSIKGRLDTTSGNSHDGIKVGDTYINAIDGDLILQNNSSLRFGADSWDWNSWGGLKFSNSGGVNQIYLGFADGSAFDANSGGVTGFLELPNVLDVRTQAITASNTISVCSNSTSISPGSAAIEIRETKRGGTDTNILADQDSYANAPRIGFHWGNRWWGNLVFWDGSFRFLDASGTAYDDIYANNVYENGTALSAKYAPYSHNHSGTYASSSHRHTALYDYTSSNSNAVFWYASDLGMCTNQPLLSTAPFVMTPQGHSNTHDAIQNANAIGWAFMPDGSLLSTYIDVFDDTGIVFKCPVYFAQGMGSDHSISQVPRSYTDFTYTSQSIDSAASYNYYVSTYSDQALKENIIDATLDVDNILDKLRIVDFNFKGDTEKRHTLGVIAQELQEILPDEYKHTIIKEIEAHDMDDPTKVNTYLGIHESRLTYIALLALQKQKKKIEDLEARLAKLENKD